MRRNHEEERVDYIIRSAQEREERNMKRISDDLDWLTEKFLGRNQELIDQYSSLMANM